MYLFFFQVAKRRETKRSAVVKKKEREGRGRRGKKKNVDVDTAPVALSFFLSFQCPTLFLSPSLSPPRPSFFSGSHLDAEEFDHGSQQKRTRWNESDKEEDWGAHEEEEEEKKKTPLSPPLAAMLTSSISFFPSSLCCSLRRQIGKKIVYLSLSSSASFRALLDATGERGGTVCARATVNAESALKRVVRETPFLFFEVDKRAKKRRSSEAKKKKRQ